MDTTKFLIELPNDLKARLKERANEKGLKLNSYIRMILTEQERLHKNELPEITNLISAKSMPHSSRPVVGFSKNKQVGKVNKDV